MRIVKSCEACLFKKQKIRAEQMEDPIQREAFLKEIKETLENRREDDSAPYMVYCFNEIGKKYFVAASDYKEIKREYNSLVLSMEAEIEEKIRQSENPLETALIYSRIGNYIDFGAMNQVDKSVFLQMLEEETKTRLDPEVYERFQRECEKAKTFLLLCDNCGEIVFDKFLLRQLKKCYPHLKYYAMVRGEDVLNDATVEDAKFSGIQKEAIVLSNGTGIAGTVIEKLPEEARNIVEQADVILSKGQGNYESIAGCGKNIFYSFLCKCDLFTARFQVPKLTGMFVSEL